MLSVIKTEVPDVTIEDLENDNICIICRGEMQVGNGKKLPCEHCLHVECLERWIAAHDKCPMCQFDLTTIISNVHDKEKIEEERQKQNNGMENLGRQIEELFNHDEEQEVYQRGNPRRIRREQQQNQQEEHEQNEQIAEEIPHEDVRNERVVHHIQRNEEPKAQIKAEEPAPVQQSVKVKKVALRKIRLPDGTIVKQFVDLSKVKPKAQQNNQ